MDCMLVDVIKQTLSSCDYSYCTEVCFTYLLDLGNECQVVFNNERYLELWNSLIQICLTQNLKDNNIINI